MPYGDLEFWKPNPDKCTSSKLHLFINESNNSCSLPGECGWFSITWSLSIRHGFLSRERLFFQQQVIVVLHKLAVKLTGFRQEVRLNDYSGLFWRPYKSSMYENSNLFGQGECFLACMTFCSLVFPQKEENL